MKKVVTESKHRFNTRRVTLGVVKNLKNKDYLSEVKAIRNFVRKNIRYVKDIRGIETIQTPEKTLEFRQGDCDDHSILISAMLESIGHVTRFKAIGLTPGMFQHVFTETLIGSKKNNKWISVETTENWPLGYQPPQPPETMIEYV